MLSLYVIFMNAVSLQGDRNFVLQQTGKQKDPGIRPESSCIKAASQRRISKMVEMRRIELLSEIHPHHKALSQ